MPGSWSVQTSQKEGASNEIANERKNGEKREKESLEASFKTPSSRHYSANFLKTVSHVKMSKRQKVRCRRVSYTSHVCKTLRATSWMADVSVEVNCHNWPIKGHTRSWYTGGGIENNAYRLQYSVSPRPPRGFHATVSRSAIIWIVSFAAVFLDVTQRLGECCLTSKKRLRVRLLFERLYFIVKCL